MPNEIFVFYTHVYAFQCVYFEKWTCRDLNSATATRNAFAASYSVSKWPNALLRGTTPATEVACDGGQQAVRAPLGAQALDADLQLRHCDPDRLRLAGLVGRVVLVAMVAGTVDALASEGRDGDDEQRFVPGVAVPWPSLGDLPFCNR